MNVHGRHKKCREGDNCTGMGCKVRTGKTERKQNWKRPKPNQHEGTRGAGIQKTGKAKA